jgi:2-amino-4-hydroxy-6-hydroxymethyldihydropteridine diphosphokinase
MRERASHLKTGQRCVIGLGSNLGPSEQALREAVAALAARFDVRRVSALYRTAAMGPVQPDYLNAAVCCSVSEPARSVLEALLEIEQRAGRVRVERWGPRTLDLDLLWLEATVVQEPGLDVPHPRLTERAFALVPLLEVVPDAREPLTHLPYSTYLDGVSQQRLSRIRSDWW